MEPNDDSLAIKRLNGENDPSNTSGIEFFSNDSTARFRIMALSIEEIKADPEGYYYKNKLPFNDDPVLLLGIMNAIRVAINEDPQYVRGRNFYPNIDLEDLNMDDLGYWEAFVLPVPDIFDKYKDSNSTGVVIVSRARYGDQAYIHSSMPAFERVRQMETIIQNTITLSRKDNPKYRVLEPNDLGILNVAFAGLSILEKVMAKVETIKRELDTTDLLYIFRHLENIPGLEVRVDHKAEDGSYTERNPGGAILSTTSHLKEEIPELWEALKLFQKIGSSHKVYKMELLTENVTKPVVRLIMSDTDSEIELLLKDKLENSIHSMSEDQIDDRRKTLIINFN